MQNKQPDEITFDGQQTGEMILATVTPHPLQKAINFIIVFLLAILLFIVSYAISGFMIAISPAIRIPAAIISVLLAIAGIWWNNHTYANTVTYITDRRIIRFEAVSPFFRAKRSLFWNEVLKAKAYSPGILWRIMNIGVVRIEPHQLEHENIMIPNVYMFEDVANYIDKIIFTFNNRPQDMGSIRPFIAKPKGHRDN